MRPVAAMGGLGLLGKRYVHLIALGNLNYKTGGSIKINMPNIGVQQVTHLLAKTPVIFLCACPDHETCYRRVAAELIREACDCEIAHLTKADLTDAPKADKPQQRELF